MTDVVDRPAHAVRTRAPGRQSEPASVVAARALDLVGEDPAAAMELAEDALVLARRQRDGVATTTALRAQGLAARATGELAVAEEKLRRAVRLALRRGDDHSAAEARMTLSFVLLDAGEVRAALRQSGLASTVLDGVQGARLLAQHGLILQRCGREAAAMETYAVAVSRLREEGDEAWEAGLRSNRGVLLAYRGHLAAAEGDLTRARDLHRKLGRTTDAAMAVWNLGFVAARRGDAVRALALYDEGDAVLGPAGIALCQRLMDRSQVMLSVGLAHEAHRLASQAMAALQTTGQGADTVECGLLLSRAALLDDRPEDAAEAARAARRTASRQERHSWALLALHLEVLALEATGRSTTAILRRAERLAEELHRANWPEAAAEARLCAARLATQLGRPAKARTLLAPLVRDRGGRTHEIRIQRWHAMAMLRRHEGDLAGGLDAARRALTALERRRAAVAATDLQLGVAATGLPIAQLAVGMAVDAGSPAQLLSSLETWRSQNVRTRAVRPPRDDDQSRALERLRRATSDVMAARLAGADATTLVQELGRAEREVIELSRRVAPSGVGPEQARSRPRMAGIREELESATLVELFALGDRMAALTLKGAAHRGRAAFITELGSLRSCLREANHLQFALGRLASGRGSAAMLAAARQSADQSVARLNALLFLPLAARLGEGPIVLVPSDGLHAIPWTILPSLSGRPVHVVPSATAWVGAKRRFRTWPGHADDTVVVTGPGLQHAEREAAAIARGPRRTRVLAGARSTVADVRSAVQGARIAHIAAHGRFESDNPMMSSLQLSDGPLMVYDLEDLALPPLQVVLAACHSATAHVHAGHELLGFAHALLWFGSSGVVATNLPAPDAETAVLMRRLHQSLANGQGVAESLWSARQAVDTTTPAGYATVAGFQAYGY